MNVAPSLPGVHDWHIRDDLQVVIDRRLDCENCFQIRLVETWETSPSLRRCKHCRGAQSYVAVFVGEWRREKTLKNRISSLEYDLSNRLVKYSNGKK